jgi:hypothetical protein
MAAGLESGHSIKAQRCRTTRQLAGRVLQFICTRGMENMPNKEDRKSGACHAPASYFEFFGGLAESIGNEVNLTLSVDDCIAGLRGMSEERALLRGLFLEVPREPTPRGSAPRMRVSSIVEHCAERARTPSLSQNILEWRAEEILRESDEKHTFRPSVTSHPSHQSRQRPDKTPARLYQSWKSKVEDRSQKIEASEEAKRQELARKISESKAMGWSRISGLTPEAVARLHQRRSMQILQERCERGDWVKRYGNDLGPDVDVEWTATPFTRALLIDRVFLRLMTVTADARQQRRQQPDPGSRPADEGASVSAVEVWKFLQAMSDHVEVEPDGPLTASIERFVERTEQVLGWQWENSEEDEDDEERESNARSQDVLISAEQFQGFLDSSEVWQGNCPDDEALHSCYRDLLTKITRPRLIKELFKKLDVDEYKVLHSKHLLHFARLYGFQGDEREWARELEDLRHRFHWGENGAAKGHFAALVSTRDPGKTAPSYFCSSLRIDYILALLEEHPPSLGDSRHISMQPFTYAASPYASSVEFSPLSSRRESTRWEAPPRSPRWRGQASPGSVGSPRKAGSPWSPRSAASFRWPAEDRTGRASVGSPRTVGSPWSPRSATSCHRPAEEPAAVVFKAASVDSFHQFLGDLKIPSAAEILSGSGPVSARA